MNFSENLRHLLYRLRERLWFWPAIVCFFSVASIYGVKLFDRWNEKYVFPEVSLDSIEALLTILATSMLTVAALAVTTMVSAYASAASTTTPRSFSLVVADSIAQSSLSIFIGAFIFSLVSLISVKNSFFDIAGRFALFVITLAVLVVVIVTFVRWVDHMARLGRMGTVVSKVEFATSKALLATDFARPKKTGDIKDFCGENLTALECSKIGYIQRIDLAKLQSLAEQYDLKICLDSLPGAFITPKRLLGSVSAEGESLEDSILAQLQKCFILGLERTYEADPRFGFITMSEIASRALSPAVNDPGTAISIIGSATRLLCKWIDQEEATANNIFYDRLYSPELAVQELIEDAFGAISRDGSSRIEVSIRLQKALQSLEMLNDRSLSDAAKTFSKNSLKRSLRALDDEDDRARIESVSEQIRD